MSKSHAKGRHKKQSDRERKPTRNSDASIYLGLGIIGAAIVGGAWLFSSGDPSVRGWAVVGYVALIAWLINLYAFGVYRGRHLQNWKLALARLPLRCAGFGRKHGKPVEAAHDEPSARTMLIVSAVISVAIVAAAAAFLTTDLIV